MSEISTLKRKKFKKKDFFQLILASGILLFNIFFPIFLSKDLALCLR